MNRGIYFAGVIQSPKSPKEIFAKADLDPCCTLNEVLKGERGRGGEGDPSLKGYARHRQDRAMETNSFCYRQFSSSFQTRPALS